MINHSKLLRLLVVTSTWSRFSMLLMVVCWWCVFLRRIYRARLFSKILHNCVIIGQIPIQRLQSESQFTQYIIPAPNSAKTVRDMHIIYVLYTTKTHSILLRSVRGSIHLAPMPALARAGGVLDTRRDAPKWRQPLSRTRCGISGSHDPRMRLRFAFLVAPCIEPAPKYRQRERE